MTNFQIQQMVVRISDGDNITLEDAISHVAVMTNLLRYQVEDAFYNGDQ